MGPLLQIDSQQGRGPAFAHTGTNHFTARLRRLRSTNKDKAGGLLACEKGGFNVARGFSSPVSGQIHDG
jgi:hypothetical protein